MGLFGCLGLGLLLYGLHIMKTGFDPLRDSQATRDLFAGFAHNPLLGILVGTIVTMVLQSSSATIAIIQVLAASNVIGLEAAIPLVLGDNIGTTITAQIASIGTNTNARRAARAHMLFNILGVLWVLPFVYTGLYEQVVDWIVPGESTVATVAHIAASHTLFNVVNTVVFMPMIGLLERAARAIVPQAKGEDDGEPRYLEPHLLDTPGAAMDGARREIVRMLTIARQAVTEAVAAVVAADRKPLREVARKEETVDRFQRKITEYLVEISRRNLEPEDAQAFPVLVHTVNDIERVSDHAENIAELAERSIEQKLVFTSLAHSELDEMWRDLDAMMADTLEGLSTGDTLVAKRALKHEERLNYLQTVYRQKHAQRLTDGTCRVDAGLVFLELVANFEKIGDHLTNINQAILGSFQWREPGYGE